MESMRVWHVTEERFVGSIRKSGLRGGSYWANSPELVKYYGQCIEQEGQKPVILEARLADLLDLFPEPDRPGLEEPITCAIGMGEEEVWEQWEKTEMDWKACLELIGSIRVKKPVPAERFEIKKPAPVMRRGGARP